MCLSQCDLLVVYTGGIERGRDVLGNFSEDKAACGVQQWYPIGWCALLQGIQNGERMSGRLSPGCIFLIPRQATQLVHHRVEDIDGDRLLHAPLELVYGGKCHQDVGIYYDGWVGLVKLWSLRHCWITPWSQASACASPSGSKAGSSGEMTKR